jgi:23S rRNA (uracil1939-C5)-methyltransferase
MIDTPVVVGDRIRIAPEELVAGGAALARVNGFPIFVKGIYPGDVALVEVTEVKRGFGRARLLEIVEHSRARKQAPCPVAETCGGCDWTALRLDHQLVAKQRILSESLRRIGRFLSIPAINLHASPLNYRLRSRLHSDGSAIGFFAEQSNEVVPLPYECEVIGPRLHGAIFGGETAGHEASLVADASALAASGRGSIETFEDDFRLEVVATGGEPRRARIRVRDFHYALSTDAFFQVNRHLLGTLIELVTAMAGTSSRRETALDLYSGVGFFSLPLARLFDAVVAVEGSPVSHRWATENAREFPNLRPVRDDVARYLKRRREMADVIFVDPPRAGLAQEVTDGIAELASERICYLSCDPVTFSRDAARLARRGWSLLSLDLVDLFPNTHHIETLSSFGRAP